MCLLFVFSFVSFFNFGWLGGVVLNLKNIICIMVSCGYEVKIVVFKGLAIVGLFIQEIVGVLQFLILELIYYDLVLMLEDVVVVYMWDYIREVE